MTRVRPFLLVRGVAPEGGLTRKHDEAISENTKKTEREMHLLAATFKEDVGAFRLFFFAEPVVDIIFLMKFADTRERRSNERAEHENKPTNNGRED